jgi:hypothetical protein
LAKPTPIRSKDDRASLQRSSTAFILRLQLTGRYGLLQLKDFFRVASERISRKLSPAIASIVIHTKRKLAAGHFAQL